MSILALIFFFWLGACIASFMSVVSERLYTGTGFISGRSRCDACNTRLSALMLLPIFSYLFLRGRARCCSSRLSVQAPITELLLGILFALSYYTLGLGIALISLLISLSFLFALTLYDLRHKILPFHLMVPFIAISAITGYLLAFSTYEFLFSALVALILASFIALIHFFSRGVAMGLADAPFVFGLALLTGPAALSGFVFSFWIGAIIGIAILLSRPSGSRMGVEVPFAPFLVAGFLLAHFTQWNILDILILPALL